MYKNFYLYLIQIILINNELFILSDRISSLLFSKLVNSYMSQAVQIGGYILPSLITNNNRLSFKGLFYHSTHRMYIFLIRKICVKNLAIKKLILL